MDDPGARVLAFAGADARGAAEWRLDRPKTDFTRHGVPYHEIMSGGPVKDGIASSTIPRSPPRPRRGLPATNR